MVFSLCRRAGQGPKGDSGAHKREDPLGRLPEGVSSERGSRFWLAYLARSRRPRTQPLSLDVQSSEVVAESRAKRRIGAGNLRTATGIVKG